MCSAGDYEVAVRRDSDQVTDIVAPLKVFESKYQIATRFCLTTGLSFSKGPQENWTKPIHEGEDSSFAQVLLDGLPLDTLLSVF